MRVTRSKDGTAIAFELTGSGPAIVLIGGALSDRSTAAPLATLIAPHFTVLCYDRRGRVKVGIKLPIRSSGRLKTSKR